MSRVEYLDHGFVELIDVMGSDESIEGAARTSYDRGTRTVNDTRNLLRYLMRHEHTSPFEMAEVVFRIKLPIFVMRQLVRHRTASLNELSLRYSEAPDEMYIPLKRNIRGQSKVNKQCSDVEIAESAKAAALIQKANLYAQDIYRQLLDLGVSREMARIVLPTSQYTMVVFKMDIKNFLHMIKLRDHPHAQAEIQELARAMYKLVKGTSLFNYTLEAFEDYIKNGARFSAKEIGLLRLFDDDILEFNFEELSESEEREFKSKLGLPADKNS